MERRCEVCLFDAGGVCPNGMRCCLTTDIFDGQSDNNGSQTERPRISQTDRYLPTAADAPTSSIFRERIIPAPVER